ncbi:hypothetical protein J7J81_01000 [bacterium]|nr:hypothetical protein [bacterium]
MPRLGKMLSPEERRFLEKIKSEKRKTIELSEEKLPEEIEVEGIDIPKKPKSYQKRNWRKKRNRKEKRAETG